MSIQRRIVDDEAHTKYATHEAIHIYDISLTSLEGECVTTADGKRVADMPELWMLAMDPFAILERAILAEDEDPRPICAARIYYGDIDNGGTITHCIRDWHHIGDHASSLE